MKRSRGQGPEESQVQKLSVLVVADGCVHLPGSTPTPCVYDFDGVPSC